MQCFPRCDEGTLRISTFYKVQAHSLIFFILFFCIGSMFCFHLPFIFFEVSHAPSSDVWNKFWLFSLFTVSTYLSTCDSHCGSIFPLCSVHPWLRIPKCRHIGESIFFRLVGTSHFPFLAITLMHVVRFHLILLTRVSNWVISRWLYSPGAPQFLLFRPSKRSSGYLLSSWALARPAPSEWCTLLYEGFWVPWYGVFPFCEYVILGRGLPFVGHCQAFSLSCITFVWKCALQGCLDYE